MSVWNIAGRTISRQQRDIKEKDSSKYIREAAVRAVEVECRGSPWMPKQQGVSDKRLSAPTTRYAGTVSSTFSILTASSTAFLRYCMIITA